MAWQADWPSGVIQIKQYRILYGGQSYKSLSGVHTMPLVQYLSLITVA